MSQRNDIRQLWFALTDAITAAYKDSTGRTGEPLPLSDYANDGRDLNQLLATETDNERRHRRFADVHDYKQTVSAEVASMAVLMHQVAEGSQKTEMPPATNFLIWRKSAAEAHLLGFLIRKYLTAEWISKAIALDYVKVMKGGR